MQRLLLVFSYLLLVISFNSPIYAQDLGPSPAGLDDIERIFTNVISVIVGLGFVALLVMLVWAGFRYLTSGGEQKIVLQAHQVVTWALLGMIFMAVAWVVLQLIQLLTGIQVTTFNIKTLF